MTPEKGSLKLNFTTPLHWYSANHKRLQINIFHISHIGDLVWVGESDRTAFINSINITNFWILQFFTMVCLIFHTVIIINRKNWRITTKLHFENLIIFLKKQTHAYARTPTPLPQLIPPSRHWAQLSVWRGRLGILLF